MVRSLTVRLLTEAFEKNSGKIIHPCFNSKRGHPPLIPISLASVILKNKSKADLKFDPEAPINETDIVYMADKPAQGDRCTTLEQRFEKAMTDLLASEVLARKFAAHIQG
jgi:hypothetical protein